MKRSILTLLVALSLVPAAGQAAERPASVRGIRALGMGDAFTAVADDQNIFFYNPAGSVQRTGSLVTLFELPITIGTDLLDAYDFIDENEDKLSNFNTLPVAERERLLDEIIALSDSNPHLSVGFPNSNYISGPMFNNFHWGFGAFGQLDGRFKLNPELIPTIDYDFNSDVIIPVNFSKRWDGVWKVPGKVGVGLNLKYVQRNQVKDDRVSVLQLEEFTAPPVQKATGLGADLGLLYQPSQRWSFALTSLDLMGTSLSFDATAAEKGFTAKPSRTSSVKTRWNLGMAWSPESLFILPTGNRLLLAMDIKDFANADSKVFFDNGLWADTAWSHLYMGAEYRWWFLRLRGGANQGYPTFGLGVDIPLVKLDYAYFSDEKGLFAGTVQESNHMISLALRFGSGTTESRDRVTHNDVQDAGGSKAPAAPAVPADAGGSEVPVETAPTPQ